MLLSGAEPEADPSRPTIEQPENEDEYQGWWYWQYAGRVAPGPVYAVVTLVPHVANLGRVEWYKDGVADVPYVGER